MSRRRLTRREFVTRAAAVGSLVLGAVPAPGVARAVAQASSVVARGRELTAEPAATPVLSFHLDRPYLDFSGEGIPYVPPTGARGAEPLEQLSETDLFRLPL